MAYDEALIGRVVDPADAELINGQEGKNLLSALSVFIAAALHASKNTEAHSMQGKFYIISVIYMTYLQAILLENPSEPCLPNDKREMVKAGAASDLPKGMNRTSCLNRMILISSP